MRLSHNFRLVRRCWLVTLATVPAIGAGDSLLCWAHAQSFGSSYSSTVSKRCRAIGGGNGVELALAR